MVSQDMYPAAPYFLLPDADPEVLGLAGVSSVDEAPPGLAYDDFASGEQFTLREGADHDDFKLVGLEAFEQTLASYFTVKGSACSGDSTEAEPSPRVSERTASGASLEPTTPPPPARAANGAGELTPPDEPCPAAPAVAEEQPLAPAETPKRGWGDAAARPTLRSSAPAAVAEVLPPGTAKSLVLTNLPVRCTRDALIEVVHGQGFAGDFDFLYMPVDLKSRRGAGSATLNFRSLAAAERFEKTFSGVAAKTMFPALGGPRKLQTTHAPIQGKEANLHKLGQCGLLMSMLAEMPEWQPQVFDEAGAVVELAQPSAPVP